MRCKHVAALLAVLGLLFVSAASLEANPYVQSLVRESGSPHIYFVDRFGLRHHVVHPDVQKAFFGKLKARKIPGFELQSMLEGGPVDFANPPQQYDRMQDPGVRPLWQRWSKGAPTWGRNQDCGHGPHCGCRAGTSPWSRYADPRLRR